MKLWQDWRELWNSFSHGSQVEYDSLKSKEEVEFYNILDIERKRLEQMRQNAR